MLSSVYTLISRSRKYAQFSEVNDQTETPDTSCTVLDACEESDQGGTTLGPRLFRIGWLLNRSLTIVVGVPLLAAGTRGGCNRGSEVGNARLGEAGCCDCACTHTLSLFYTARYVP